ncbi:AcrR family transcriptional regulator [Caulobacter ginsengisoli]|uniref:AcrR family transcriptional regulator n=1 Tax=Caulobacter ginsengisoli TaxID=400775 RepID=A0ABU0IP19_9CAUL|nr:helix-turn-helix domain-containing protein [Caulobacter ginsengisoli]MDQ0463746.1 AcrR family transcriptional regulator [Caulobacter ginsengisoli]
MVRSESAVDRRRVRTRTALLQAGQSLFAARSVDAVSVDDIVGTAEVAKGSFYNHFTDKDDLAREIAAVIRAEVEALVDATNRDIADPAIRMARAFAVYVRYAHEQPQRAKAMLRLLAGATLPDLPLNRGVRSDLEAGLAAGRFSGLPLQSALLLVMGVVQVGLIHVLEHPTDEAWIAIVPLLAGQLRGLGVPFDEAQALARAAIHDV